MNIAPFPHRATVSPRKPFFFNYPTLGRDAIRYRLLICPSSSPCYCSVRQGCQQVAEFGGGRGDGAEQRRKGERQSIRYPSEPE